MTDGQRSAQLDRIEGHVLKAMEAWAAIAGPPYADHGMEDWAAIAGPPDADQVSARAVASLATALRELRDVRSGIGLSLPGVAGASDPAAAQAAQAEANNRMLVTVGTKLRAGDAQDASPTPPTESPSIRGAGRRETRLPQPEASLPAYSSSPDAVAGPLPLDGAVQVWRLVESLRLLGFGRRSPESPSGGLPGDPLSPRGTSRQSDRPPEPPTQSPDPKDHPLDG